MEEKKTYWIIGMIAAIAIIIMIVFGVTRSSSQAAPQKNAETDSQTAPHKNTEADSQTALQLYLKEQEEIMSGMMEDMEVEPSGNAAIDFLVGMIPHHDSAIDMAESYLKHGGSNPKLKQLAEDIILAQTEEIDQMRDLIKEIEDSGETDEEKEEAYLAAYHEMMSHHEHMNHGSASDVETAFAEGMLMHHEMAVDMSKAVLEYTDHEKVRNLAETIIKAQEQEIRLMQEILEQDGTDTAS